METSVDDRHTEGAVAVDLPSIRRTTHVTLIRPNTITLPASLTTYGAGPPIGIAYIAAVLRDIGGHQVDVIDAAGEGIGVSEEFESPVGPLRRHGIPLTEILDRIDPATRIVGITHMFLHEWPDVRAMAEAVRARFPDVVILLGGENATAFNEWIFDQTDAVDACVLGEGEATALELADRVANGISFQGMAGIATADKGEIDHGGLAPRIATRKIDSFPRPAWDMFPIDKYFAHAAEFGDSFGIDRGRTMPVLATRGCPYECSFCSSPQMWTTRYVVRDPKEVADEIGDYVDKYGVDNINFADLTAITKRSWALAFCDALIERVPGITWQLPVGSRSEVLDAEVLQRLWDSGCRNITYAPEAGGEKMLKVYDKKVNLDKMIASIEAATKIGHVTKVNFIVGHPKERWPDVWKTLRFMIRAARSGAADTAVMMFGPYPGSGDFKDMIQKGTLDVNDSYHYVALSWSSGEHESYHPYMTGRQLRLAQLIMMATFYAVGNLTHPKRIFSYIRAYRTGTETTAIDALIRTKRRRRTPPTVDAPATQAA